MPQLQGQQLQNVPPVVLAGRALSHARTWAGEVRAAGGLGEAGWEVADCMLHIGTARQMKCRALHNAMHGELGLQRACGQAYLGGKGEGGGGLGGGGEGGDGLHTQFNTRRQVRTLARQV